MTIKRVLMAAAAVLGLFGLALGFAFLSSRTAIKNEWQYKLADGPRSPEERRGLIDNMYAYRSSMVPAFVPRSGWDDGLCAANVIGAVNFILGEERLAMSTAWEFSEVNAEKIYLAYKRDEDFRIVDEDGVRRVIEIRDRGFNLSKILRTQGKNGHLTSDRIYIVGYHYRESRFDHLIIDADKDMNSHLMLILGRYDGSWWGYHMVHNPDTWDTELPFRIDDLGEDMPEWFDLVYIWEVKDTEMPRQGDDVVLFYDPPDYTEVVDYVGHFGRGRLGYAADTVIGSLLFNGEQFPRVMEADGGLIKLVEAYDRSTFRGDTLGYYNGVPIFRHARDSRRGEYGMEFQCVEFINRYYAVKLGHRNMAKTGHADSYFFDAKAKGLKAYENGSAVKPAVDDILIFDRGNHDGSPGHVGIVYTVAHDRVCVVQQNSVPWYGCLSLEQRDGGWQVGDMDETLPCLGWARKEG